ncbi:alpha-glucosidase-like protein [Dermatophagoides farinae]|uniref:Alpha-glucosidase-like protein n=1 Tax=Dermatophagoides farinae TaxID=6954 RepID=A0A9D4SGE0_DERFA|nr:alpha-glucosidase-like protein [Dermatophagoides farinae]
MESKYVDIPLNNNDNDDEENTSTTIQRRIHQQNSTADKQNNNDLHVMVRKIFCNHFVPFVGLFALCAFIGIGTPMIWNQIWKPNSNVTIETDLRYDCSPLKPKKSEKCSEICKLDQLAKYDEIRCYYRMETSEDIDDDSILMPRYSIEQINDFNYLLSLKTPPPFIHDQKNDDLSKDPIIHRKLSLSIRYHNPNHSSVLIKPIHEDETLWSKNFDFNYQPHNSSIDSEAEITVENDLKNNYFQLKIRRKSTDAKLFDMGSHTPFIYANGYIEITTLLVNDIMYGLGQSNQPFRHNFSIPRKWNLLNQYHDNLTMNATSLFGSHPFYLGIDNPKQGNAYGVLLLNSFPIQAIINARPSLTLRTMGGHVELHFFYGPRPIDVIRQLQNFIHKPAMPPYWSLGFHMCHTKCSDQNQFNQFASQLHNAKIHWISATIPHLLTTDGDLSQDQWNKNVLMMKKSDTDTKRIPYSGLMTGCSNNVAQNQKAYFPDLFNRKSRNLYSENELNSNADGFILDWNTPVNLANGNHSCLSMLNHYKWNYYYFASLNNKNPCLDLLLSESSSSSLINDNKQTIGPYLALHNMYGLKHSQAVYEKFIKNQRKRPFIMSLATFLGSGRYGGHIATPINGTWEMLQFSMKQMLDFSLFGIPMSGFPVGGYKGEKREKNGNLMRQWYQLASMQPFMIAYSGYLQSETQYTESLENTIRSAIKTRYRILPYLYTLFYRASTDGDLVAQPLFIQFPTDILTYKIQNQYMLGSALMISPSLEQDRSSIMVHFPKGRWYDFYSGQIVWNNDDGVAELSVVNINIHLRGGHMVIIQESSMTIEETRENNGFQLYGGFDRHRQASGELYLDSGDDLFPAKRYMQVFFQAEYTNLTITIQQNEDFCRAMKNQLQKKLNTILETVKLCGVIEKPNPYLVDVYEINPSNDQMKKLRTISGTKSIQFDAKLGVLVIKTDLDLCNVPYSDRHVSINKFFLNWNYTKYEI